MNALETDVAESISTLKALSHEWTKEVSVIRGVMYNPLTYSEKEGAPVYLLRSAVLDFDLPRDATNGEVNRYPGLFSVPHTVIDKTKALNEAKQHLQAAVKALEKAGYTSHQMRTVYRLSGATRLHPKHAWRQISILPGNDIASIGFTVAKKLESSALIPIDDAIEMLVARGADSIADQLYGSGAVSVRWHEPIAKHIRANVVWGSAEHRLEKMYYASMPFLIEGDCWPFKRVRFNVPRSHNRRSDARVEASIPLPFRDGGHLTVMR